MINGSIQEEDITIIHVPSRGATQYIKQMLTSMRGEINTVMVGAFSIPFTPMDRSTKQKISEETQALNDTVDQLDLIDICISPKNYGFQPFLKCIWNR